MVVCFDCVVGSFYWEEIMKRFKYRLWVWWHSYLAFRVFGVKRYFNRPWWHLCCNGESGGWRTAFCDWLEDYPNGWRYLEDRLYPYEEEEE